MIHYITKFILIVFAISVFSCTGSKTELPDLDRDSSKLILLPDNYKNYNMKPLIILSGLNRGGYALIITDGEKKSGNTLRKIRSSLVQNQIIAFHSIELSKRRLTNAEKIAIENANLIIFTGEFTDEKSMMKRTSEFGYFVQKAFDNSAVIAMYGESSIFAGTKYCSDGFGKKENCNFIEGLGLTDYETVIVQKADEEKNDYYLNDSILITNTHTPLLITDREYIYDLSKQW